MASECQVIIGIDSSTQSTKLEAYSIVNGADGGVSLGPAVFSTKVTYQEDLPNLCLDPGCAVHTDSCTGSATQPPNLWFTALDEVLLRAKTAGVTARAVALSLSAQQHAAVYWGDGLQPAMQSCAQGGSSSSDASLAQVFSPALSLPEVPIWMDSSTSAQCTALVHSLAEQLSSDAQPPASSSLHTGQTASSDGEAYLAATTGSSAYERFTVLQCVALAQRQPGQLQATQHVRLLSAALTSMLVGKLTPHDASDAAGMNALRLPCAPAETGADPWAWDARVLRWADAALAKAGVTRSIAALFGKVLDVHAQARSPSRYVADRFGLPVACAVVTGTGDNPCALAGLAPQYTPQVPPPAYGTDECMVLSLGTSDTVLGTAPWTSVAPLVGAGHVMPAPLSAASHCMTMLCVKNGGLVREALASACAGAEGGGKGGIWGAFNAACAQQLQALVNLAPGNSVLVGLVLPLAEIVPHTSGPTESWWTASVCGGSEVTFTQRPAPSCPMKRAGGAALGQLCNLAYHSAALTGASKAGGKGAGGQRCLRMTGGGAQSAAFVDLASCVFRSPVYKPRPEEAGVEGAARGAAVRAFHVWVEGGGTGVHQVGGTATSGSVDEAAAACVPSTKLEGAANLSPASSSSSGHIINQLICAFGVAVAQIHHAQ